MALVRFVVRLLRLLVPFTKPWFRLLLPVDHLLTSGILQWWFHHCRLFCLLFSFCSSVNLRRVHLGLHRLIGGFPKQNRIQVHQMSTKEAKQYSTIHLASGLPNKLTAAIISFASDKQLISLLVKCPNLALSSTLSVFDGFDKTGQA